MKKQLTKKDLDNVNGGTMRNSSLVVNTASTNKKNSTIVAKISGTNAKVDSNLLGKINVSNKPTNISKNITHIL